MRNRTRKMLAELLTAAMAVTFIPGTASASVVGMITAPTGAQTEVQTAPAAVLESTIEGISPAEADAQGVLTILPGTYTVKVQAQAGEVALDAPGLTIEASEDAETATELKDRLYYVPLEAITEGSCAADAAAAVTHFVLAAAEDGTTVLKIFAGEQELNPDEAALLLIVKGMENESELSGTAIGETAGELAAETAAETESVTGEVTGEGAGAGTEPEELTEAATGVEPVTGEVTGTETATETELVTEAVTGEEAGTETEAGMEVPTEAATEAEAVTGEVTGEGTGSETGAEVLTEAAPETELVTGEVTGEETGSETEAGMEALTEAAPVTGEVTGEETGTETEAETEVLTEAAETAIEGMTETESADETETETEPVTEIITETEADTELETEIETEAEPETEPVTEELTEVETESETELPEEFMTDLFFENDEVTVTVTATAEAQLPMNTVLIAEKLSEDSEAYLEAKAAADEESGADPAAMSYTFYRIKLMSDGEELHPAAGTLTAQIEFKNIEAAEDSEQNIFHVKDTGSGKVAEKVDADEEGNSLSSEDFEI